MSDETKVDPPKKTPSRMLVELLQSPEIDHMKNMVIVYEDDKGTAVVGGHRDRFEVIGMLQFGIMIVYEGSRKKGSYEQE